jgi:hypothetical protein
MSDGYYSSNKKKEPTPFIGSIMTMYLTDQKEIHQNKEGR